MNEQQRKAMELALEALENAQANFGEWWTEDITAIKEALTQDVLQALHNDNKSLGLYESEQEPVKYEFQVRDGTWHPFLDKTHYEKTVEDGSWPIRALYTTPPQRKPLTDEELIAKALHLSGLGTSPDVLQFARAIEAAHGIKE